MTKQRKQPTAGDGVRWWNSLTEPQRLAALKAANTATVAVAWRHHCRVERNLTLAAKAEIAKHQLML
jgi:hypothetical protein